MIFLTAAGRAAARPPERAAAAVGDYVRLEEWGESVHCAMKWDKKQGGIELSGAGPRLNFTIDSRRAEVSGVTVWLALPVVNRNGSPLISQGDLHTSIEPLLSPRKSGERVQTVCLDPGHGGKDPGNVAGRNYEKKYTLLLAEETAALLKEQGFKVVHDADQ